MPHPVLGGSVLQFLLDLFNLLLKELDHRVIIHPVERLITVRAMEYRIHGYLEGGVWTLGVSTVIELMAKLIR